MPPLPALFYPGGGCFSQRSAPMEDGGKRYSTMFYVMLFIGIIGLIGFVLVAINAM